MSKRPKKKGTSKLMRQKMRFEHERGSDLADDGKDWTGPQNDKFLDLWFAGKGLKTIADELERPVSTVENRAWKFVTGYKSCRGYKPFGIRVARTGPFNKREVQAIHLGLGEHGQSRRSPVDLTYLALIMGRRVDEIEYYLSSRKPQGPGFGLV